jgi:hypothetical protein
MEEQWYADRSQLRALLASHPTRSNPELAAQLGRSLGWVKKWKRRLRAAPPGDETVLRGRSRARKHPPANLQRVPGPKAILYYLERDGELAASGARLPRSTGTIWRILTRAGRIARPARRERELLDRPPPLTHWQLDFKDISSVPGDPDGKRQHAVEALNCVDCGTSLVVATDVRADFTEETAAAAVAELLAAQGLPRSITVDRDPRFVGRHSGRDFPPPFVRFLACLGVEVDVCPPRRPDKNCYVERYHGTLQRECLAHQQPSTLDEARAVTAAFRDHYNHERPNQARSCGNRPPRTAFPTLPRLPTLPAEVDPDRWLQTVHRRRFVRKVRRDGSVLVAEATYHVKQALAGQQVVAEVDADARMLVIWHRHQVVKRVPIKGLRGGNVPFDDFLARIRQEARSDWRTWLRHHRAA